MAIILIAIISLNTVVRASNADLQNYIRNAHVLNSMMFELSNDSKTKLNNLASKLDDATSDAILSDIKAAEQVIIKSGVSNHNDLTAEQQAQIVAYAKSAAQKAGAELTVNLSNRTYSLKKGSDLNLSGKIDDLITDPGTGSSSSGSSTTTTTSGKTLLYTGANYAIYALATVAIVAVAVVVKKKS